MKGLILKDINYLKKEWIISLVVVAVFSLINIFIGLGISGTQFVFSFVMAVLVNASFTKDELNNWNEYALTMPISRKDIVKGKYIFAIISFFIAVLLGTLIGSLTNIMGFYEMTREHIQISQLGFSYLFLGFIGALTIYTIIVFVNIPIAFKEGSAKGKQLTYSVYFAVFIVYAIIKKRVDFNLINILMEKPMTVAIIFLVISLIVVIGTYPLSIKYFNKKEF